VQDRQNHLSVRVEKVKHRARPWKSIIALVLAIASAVISRAAHHDSDVLWTTSRKVNEVVAVGTGVLFLIFGSIATYGLAGKSKELLEPRAGTEHSAVIRYVILVVGGVATFVIALWLFGVDVSTLLLSGAVTSVFLGIAAQQALGNVFAGLVLLFARPFVVGQAIRLRAGALGGTLDGTVTEIGITYVRLDTGSSVVTIPNSQVLNAVIGPIPPADEDDAPPAAIDGKSGTPGGPEQPQPAPPGPA
jgi:small-conductance mechanosensitive channel